MTGTGDLGGLHQSQVPAARAAGGVLFTQPGRIEIRGRKGRDEHLVVIIVVVLPWRPAAGKQGLPDVGIRPEASDGAAAVKHTDDGSAAWLAVPLGWGWCGRSHVGRAFLSRNLRETDT